MIFESLRPVMEQYDNVLYFCSFDRSRGVNGKEILMVGDSPPIQAYDPGEVEDLFSEFENKSEPFPLILPFDFTQYAYPNLHIRRSGLPFCITFAPDFREDGTFVRKEEDIELISSQKFTDRKLESRIADARGRILDGELLQVVLSRNFSLPEADMLELVSHHLKFDRSRYVFYFKTENFAIAGSSPENLVSRVGRNLEISTIAGTVSRSPDPNEDETLSLTLKRSEKDKLEHRMLVDLARNDLGKVSVPGSVHVLSSMKVRRYRSVQHLVSLTASVLRQNCVNLDVAKAVFPAGTVSGAPKERALRLITQYEEDPRGFYSGAVGVVSRETLDLGLMIRSVYASSIGTHTRAGAGIVKDSIPEKEVQEMMDKALSVSGGILSANVDD